MAINIDFKTRICVSKSSSRKNMGVVQTEEVECKRCPQRTDQKMDTGQTEQTEKSILS